MTPWERLREVLALRRNVVVLLAMIVLIGMGERMFERFLPRYLEALGATPVVIGWLGFLQNALGAIYGLPGGYLTDRLGHKRSLLLFAFLNLVGYALLLGPHWSWVLVATAFYMGWSQFSLPATFSLIAEQLPRQKRVMGLAVQAIIRRVPMALGPLVGGAILTAYGLQRGMPVVVGIAALLTILAVGVTFKLSTANKSQGAYEPLHMFALWRTFRPELKRLLLSDILVRFCEQIPYSFVVLWVTDIAHHSDLDFGILSAIEMATAASLYIPVALWVDARVRAASSRATDSEPLLTERKPFVIATFCFFTAFPAALYFARSFPLLIAAFVIRGLKEFGEPSRKATIVDLALPSAKARTVGLYYLIRDLTVAFAALSGGLLWNISPALNLWTAFGCGVLGTVVYAMTKPRN